MMNTQEISDEVAETSTSMPPILSQEGPQGPIVSVPLPAAVFPELSPGRSMTGNKTVDEVVAELKKTPFFMTELEENDETEALKALAYEGTPLENASEFKEQGNECFKAKRWADAKEFYTKGIVILAAEERKRRQAAEGTPSQLPPKEKSAEESEGKDEGEQDGDKKEKEETSEEDIQKERAILESLYGNRAACHLELQNYRSCWLDGSAALRLNPNNIKAYYRSARAFLAVDRVAEADDACARGLTMDPSNNALRTVARDIVKKSGEVGARSRREAERAAQEKHREALVKLALKAREIRTTETARPPDMEDAGIKLVPDPDNPRSHLVFPTLLLYPIQMETDFIKSFNEMDTLADHLKYILPLPWDTEGAYTPAGVQCYMNTVTGNLIKLGKKVPLLKALVGGKVEVVDQVVRIFVLPEDEAASWVEDEKKRRSAAGAVRF